LVDHVTIYAKGDHRSFQSSQITFKDSNMRSIDI